MRLLQYQFQERRFAGAVAADKTDAAAGRQMRAGAGENFSAGNAVGDVFDRQHASGCGLWRCLACLAAWRDGFYKAAALHNGTELDMAFERTLSIIKPD